MDTIKIESKLNSKIPVCITSKFLNNVWKEDDVLIIHLKSVNWGVLNIQKMASKFFKTWRRTKKWKQMKHVSKYVHANVNMLLKTHGAIAMQNTAKSNIILNTHILKKYNQKEAIWLKRKQSM